MLCHFLVAPSNNAGFFPLRPILPVSRVPNTFSTLDYFVQLHLQGSLSLVLQIPSSPLGALCESDP
jgi:hypothetical protein